MDMSVDEQMDLSSRLSTFNITSCDQAQGEEGKESDSSSSPPPPPSLSATDYNPDAHRQPSKTRSGRVSIPVASTSQSVLDVPEDLVVETASASQSSPSLPISPASETDLLLSSTSTSTTSPSILKISLASSSTSRAPSITSSTGSKTNKIKNINTTSSATCSSSSIKKQKQKQSSSRRAKSSTCHIPDSLDLTLLTQFNENKKNNKSINKSLITTTATTTTPTSTTICSQKDSVKGKQYGSRSTSGNLLTTTTDTNTTARAICRSARITSLPILLSPSTSSPSSSPRRSTNTHKTAATTSTTYSHASSVPNLSDSGNPLTHCSLNSSHSPLLPSIPHPLHTPAATAEPSSSTGTLSATTDTTNYTLTSASTLPTRCPTAALADFDLLYDCPTKQQTEAACESTLFCVDSLYSLGQGQGPVTEVHEHDPEIRISDGESFHYYPTGTTSALTAALRAHFNSDSSDSRGGSTSNNNYYCQDKSCQQYSPTLSNSTTTTTTTRSSTNISTTTDTNTDPSSLPSPDTNTDSYYRTSSTSTSPLSIESSPQPRTPPFEHHSGHFAMPPSTSPIDIATPTRNSSSSPSSQGTKIGANYLGLEDSRTSAMMSGGGGLDPNMGRGRQESFAGAKPISMNNPNRGQDSRMRRESLAGSLVGGMSWGGVSVGSWIRDDIIMTGTSPFPYQSPSFHSSSYLPKLEANFMRDFSCCGKTLPTLHDLLQHYEECHAQQTPQSMRQASMAQQARDSQQRPDNKAAIAAQAASQLQQQQKQQIQQQTGRPQSSAGMRIPQTGGASALTGGIQQMRQQQQTSQPATPTQAKAQPAPVAEDMEGVEDMEMDDPVGPMDPIDTPVANPSRTSASGFGQRPALNLTNTNGMVHQGLRTSQPTTPSASGFGFQNNPTVSSVNTPTLTTQPMQSQGTFSPDGSAPGTPAELDEDYSNMMNMNNMTMGNMNMNLANMNMNNMNMFNLGNDLGLDLCIDEPAKRLYSPNGGFANQQQRQLQQQLANFNLGNNAFGGMSGMQGMGNMSNEELMRRFQAQRLAMMNGMAGMSNQQGGMMGMGEEHKPFKCPVIGCEKAYKNQNGLKYHKTHGHQTQQLHENGDGTFSIVNPETSAPYPGTLGMEKEKPYKCDVCGKRYKNLNGLKYHKQHSPPCNPELKLNGHLQAAGLTNLSNIGVAGLPGIGEESMM